MTAIIENIYDIMRAKLKYGGDRYSGDFGIEIETETRTAYEVPKLKYWNTTRDNSLRDFGIEYVLKGPMNHAELDNAFSEFGGLTKKISFNKDSISTSVHVHLNFLNDTYLTLANFFTAYSLVENVLIRFSGPDRLSNLFCLPMVDAEGVARNLKTIMDAVNRGVYEKTRVSVDRVKYGAINPATLTTLGTVEIRSFRGETDTRIIDTWISILEKLKQFSSQPGLTPPKILELWKDNKHNIIDIIFQEYAKQLKTRTSKEEKEGITLNAAMNNLIETNLKFAADIATSSRNWNNFGKLKIKPVYREKVKDTLESISKSKLGVSFDSLDYHERLLIQEEYQRMYPTLKIVDIDEDM